MPPVERDDFANPSERLPSRRRTIPLASIVRAAPLALGLAASLAFAGIGAAMLAEAFKPPAAAFERSYQSWRARHDLHRVPPAALRDSSAFFGPSASHFAPVAVREGRLLDEIMTRGGVTHLSCIRPASYNGDARSEDRFVMLNNTRWRVPEGLSALPDMSVADFVELRDGQWRMNPPNAVPGTSVATDIGACAWLAWRVAVLNDLGLTAEIDSNLTTAGAASASLRDIIGR